ncbi:MALT paracaspase 2 isoform X2 [Boleophthalmus pectinirostris]|uniref:MALT paracaspase 2 isoform X2 n=1 Tax=Boleophthalmus pectinirostris TaxID=150288 RepID=UPI002431D0E8|nr:MALT paracaspase 2 isoform X2 [Boleophthalmus pectinirostris]
MDQWKAPIGTLREDVLKRLSKMLDNSTCGWRQLAHVMSEDPKFRSSESEMTSYSLQVLSNTGSPSRTLLARLADQSCTLNFLLWGLKKINHQDAVHYLTHIVSGRIEIIVQPQSHQVQVGSKVILSCKASGSPGLCYQWFKGKEEILDGTSPVLVLSPFSSTNQGHYICRVSLGDSCVFSQWAHVCLADSSSGCHSSIFQGSVSGLRIIRQPQSQALTEGDALHLECQAVANPPAQYEWYHNSEPMQQHQTQSLKIPHVTTAHRGQYKCKTYNLYHEVWSEAAVVTIGPISVIDASWVEVDTRSPGVIETEEPDIRSKEMERFPAQQMASPYPPVKQFYATDKVALLIGNMNYMYHTQLSAPIADVHELTNLLRQMDFKVVSLLDLNWQEMHSAVTEFLLLLDKGVYGLLYFAGHGYENYGNSFMVPIDAPASYTSDHCLCVQKILTRMQERETGLNVFLLDMCRKRNPHDDVLVQTGLLKVTANIVFGYATCADAEAYEVKKEDVSNGIFINFLKRRVCEDEKVTVMLDRVAEDMGRCRITHGRQALELRSNLSERRCLTDHIQTAECSASYSARNLQWTVAHVLPPSQTLQFDCGVIVQLGFAAEFSNVMVIYTRILEKPENIVFCSAQLTDFPVDVEIDLKKSNQETLLEAGSLLLINETLPAEAQSRYTRVYGLQRLKKELIFTVCLHYTYSKLDDEIQEKQSVTAGKPLVSKLNLYERRHSQNSKNLYSCHDHDSFKIPVGSLYASEGLSLDAIASSSHLQRGQAASGANIPQETDYDEQFDAPQPLITE